jgi:hypothetical protein
MSKRNPLPNVRGFMSFLALRMIATNATVADADIPEKLMTAARHAKARGMVFHIQGQWTLTEYGEDVVSKYPEVIKASAPTAYFPKCHA